MTCQKDDLGHVGLQDIQSTRQLYNQPFPAARDTRILNRNGYRRGRNTENIDRF